MKEEPTATPNKRVQSAKRFFRYIYLTIRRYAGLAEDTDIGATIQTISKSILFRGANLWILAFAIIIASVGLDVNSTAVIIGAMLISPLMGPINGVGLAIGISDSDLLRKSLTNFLLMVLVSIIASTLYFLLSPLSDAQSELLARTRPTIFDVFIAFFGGMAGIVALSRKDQPFTIISGVAIATALMPPLCTAGFGLATGNINYFLGAFYLFFLNSFFIALATFIMVRFLRFPQKKYLDPGKSKTVRRFVTLVTIVVLIPSIFMAISVIRESAFNNNAIHYISDIQETPVFENAELLNIKKEYGRKKRTITLSVLGQPLEEKDIDFLTKKLLEYGLTKTELRIKQTNLGKDTEVESILLENILDKKDRLIAEKDSLIKKLEDDILSLNNSNMEYSKIAREIAVQYPDIAKVSISNMTFTNTQTLETKTVPTLFIKWKNKPVEGKKEQLVNWLKVRLGIEEVEVIEVA